MTSPAIPSPKGEEETPIELARRVVDTWGDGNPPIVVLARALLSSSSREEVRREALEMFEEWWEESLPRALIDAGITGTVVGPKTQAMLDAVRAALSQGE